jgi:DNA-binding beta-propeller fold protein YncE
MKMHAFLGFLTATSGRESYQVAFNPTKEIAMQNPFLKCVAMAALSAGFSLTASAQTITTTIPFNNATLGIAADPVRNKIYVVEPSNGTASTDSLAVIDGSTDTVAASISVPSGALFVTVDYLANRVYVAGCDFTQDPTPCTVTEINGKTNAVVASLLVTTTPGFGIAGIVANPLTHLVYVANGSDNVINIIRRCEEGALKLVGSISTGVNIPAAIAINPFLNRLYVPYGSDAVGIISASKKTIIGTTVFGSNTVGAAVNLVTGHVFVTDDETGPSMTGVLNSKGAVLGSVTVDDSPLGVDVDPVTNLAFVASSALDSVDVIDGSTNTVQTVVNGVPASYVAVNFATTKVYVSGRTGVTVMTEK